MALSKEEIIGKIMKLMELGNEEKNSNPHEREAATRMAAKLMAEYCVDFAELRSAKPSEDSFATMEVDGSEDHKVDFESSLAGAIARAFDCKVLNLIHFGPWKISFVGSKHDLDIAVYFFKHVRRTMYVMARNNVTEATIRPSTYSRSGMASTADVKNARRNYCFGMVQTISQRLLDLYMRREEFIPADSKALMVIKKDGLDKFFHDKYPHTRSGRSISLKGDLRSYERGKEDGRRVNLSRPISHTGRGSAAQIG
jgi:hypothetical protein